MGSESTAKAVSSWTPAYGINLHKLIAAPVTAALMWKYACFTSAAWIYMALHGIYGVLWVAKDVIFPDRNFMQPCSFAVMLTNFVMLNLVYFSIPWALVYHAKNVPEWYSSIAIAVFTAGMFLMTGSDCQKYYTLKAKPGKLITTGFFKYVRSPNYLGELLIYTSFSMLTCTPWGYILTVIFLVGGALPGLAKKDRSMSRYPEFADYKASSYRMLPPLF